MNKYLFPHITRWLLLLIPFTFIGFFPTYFSKFFTKIPSVYHIHAFFMSLWVVMAIVQPILIKQKNTSMHKRIGKISYILMPLVLATAFMVIRHTYYSVITNETAAVARGVSSLTNDEILSKAASHLRLGILYFLWLAVFYALAVINRKKILFHATYMFAAILTILGPTVDRVIGHACDYLGLPYTFFAENIVFISILLILSKLMFYQWRKGNTLTPVGVSLGVYCVGLIIFYTMTNTAAWRSIVELIL